jgi:hypothetical protein
MNGPTIFTRALSGDGSDIHSPKGTQTEIAEKIVGRGGDYPAIRD